MHIFKSIRQLIPFKSYLRRALDTIRPLPKLSLQDFPGDSLISPFESAIDTLNPLHDLGNKYKPTKKMHDYLKYYWMHFRDIRFNVKNVLEIGVDSGASIKMWEEFFPNANVHGIDTNPECKKFEGNRRYVHIGDASDPQFLGELVDKKINFDIVIDDGSHRMDHQLASLNYLLPRMTRHGIYVIEDTGPCVGDHNLRVLKRVSKLVRNINYWPSSLPVPWPPNGTELKKNWLNDFPRKRHWADRHIVGISFYRFIIFIHRGLNPDDNPFFSGNI